MNPKNLKLKIVVMLVLVFALSSLSLASLAYASEVTGNLSSSGNNNPNPPQAEPEEENAGDDISGSVAGGSNNSGGSSGGSYSRSSAGATGTNGAVLGEATYNPSPSNTSSFYYPSGGTLTAGGYDASSGDALAQLPPIEENAGNASLSQYEPSLTPAADEGWNLTSWFWIILLSLLLLGVLGYFYSRPAHDDMMQGI